MLGLMGALTLAGVGIARSETPVSDSTKSADGVRWITLSNGYRVWTRRVGSGKTKVLLLNGGPGLSHEYMSCFANFLPQAGYELYFYDQLGCGSSDKPHDTRLWTLPRYLREVEEVRSALGFDRMVVIGHSCGGILGIEYVLHYPQHVQAFVLSDMSASFADYGNYVDHLRQQLPLTVRTRMSALEKAGKMDGDEYQGLLMKYLYAQYICRSNPWPDSLQKAFAGINTEIYQTMQGPNEFTPTGNLKDWDRWASLPKISAPTLVMGARYDEMNPASERREARLIPGAELFISETGSHLAMWDDQDAYFKALLNFLDKHRSAA
jgi:proline iminopeptidase